MFDESQGVWPMSPVAPVSAPVVVPERFAALEVAARAAVTAAGGAEAWAAPARRGVLGLLDRVTDAVVAARAAVVAAERAAGTWGLAGDRDLAGYLGRVSRQGRGAGMAAVGEAGTLSAMPVVAEALVDGPVTARHVRELTRVAAASPVLAAELATPEGQAGVVELAGRLDGAAFGRHLRRRSAALDPAGRQREHDAQRAARYLHLAHTAGGTRVTGLLDQVAGYRLGKAIDALCPRPGVDDDRDRGQRQADALVVMADRVLTDTATTPGSTAPVQAVVTFTEATWVTLRRTRDDGSPARADRPDHADRRDEAHRSGHADHADGSDRADRSGAAGRGAARGRSDAPVPGSVPGVVAALRGVPGVVDETGVAWPASEVGRALCDCALTRAVVDARGQVLDLGRAQRLFTRAQYLALYASGQRTCAVAGCGVLLRYTELHHMTWWQRQGRTDLANCAPECSFHHHEIHRHDIRVTRRPDGTYTHQYPDGRPYGGTPPDTPAGPPTHGGIPPERSPAPAPSARPAASPAHLGAAPARLGAPPARSGESPARTGWRAPTADGGPQRGASPKAARPADAPQGAASARAVEQDTLWSG